MSVVHVCGGGVGWNRLPRSASAERLAAMPRPVGAAGGAALCLGQADLATYPPESWRPGILQVEAPCKCHPAWLLFCDLTALLLMD